MLYILIAIILGGIVLDQASKLLVVQFMELHESVPLIPNVLHFTYIHNRGAAFGSMTNMRWLFMIISTVAILGLGIYLFRFCRKGSPMLQISLAMIISGGIGNMIDRVRLEYVIDFIDFCAFPFWTWIFNVADAFVVVGGGLMMLSLILDEVKAAKRKKAEEDVHAEDNA
ncbi:MAG: signal peptidase II [Clostridia bacterium]|nr:signal peptidase II [Clostridia bacterium]